MVRIKHRYLLVNILYPDGEAQTASKSSSHGSDDKLPPIVDLRRPSPSYLSAGLLVRHIRDHVELLYGDYGIGATGSGMTIKYFSQATSTFIVRCPLAHYRLIWSALTFMTQLPKTSEKGKRSHSQQSAKPDQSCIMRVVRVSGTIRKSEEEAIRRARADILRAQRQAAEGADSAEASSTLDAIFSTAPELPEIDDDDMDDDDDDAEDDEI